MAAYRDIREMVDWVKEVHDTTLRGANKGVIAATQEAVKTAKMMTTKWTGQRNPPHRTGALMNAIQARFVLGSGNRLSQGVVAVLANKGRNGTKPYGRVHEFGAGKGTPYPPIKPVNAKALWIPMTGRPSWAKNLTPSQFFDMKRSAPSNFGIIPSKDGKGALAAFLGTRTSARLRKGETFTRRREMVEGARESLTPLFWLTGKVDIPERPFVRPAIKAVLGANGMRFLGIIQTFISRERVRR